MRMGFFWVEGTDRYGNNSVKMSVCGNESVRPYGISNGKKRYAVTILSVSIKHFTRNTPVTAAHPI
jgi:hypothetical protein